MFFFLLQHIMWLSLVEVVVGIFQELVEDEPVADVAPGQDKPQTAPHVLVILVSNLWRDNGIDHLLGCQFAKFSPRDLAYLGIDQSKSKLVEEERAQAIAGKDHRQNYQDREVPPVNVIIPNKAIFKFCHTAVAVLWHSPDDEVDLLVDDVL